MAAGTFHLAGVMGHPVMHSRSPMLHTHWLRQHGFQGAYVPLEVAPQHLEKALRALPYLNFAGCNLTIPHKEMALHIVDEVDPNARRIGAINCIVVRQDGSLLGRNYDGWGYLESVREAKPDWRADAGPVVVLGAGGAARSILVALADAGAREIRLLNRSPARAEGLAQELGSPIVPVAWEARATVLQDAAMLINTTSQGMVGEPPLDINLDALPVPALVSDIVYVPMETALLRDARARGHVVVNGLGMLLHQARPAFRDWFGVMPDVTPDLRAMIEATI